mmetsp:Transcript_4683/g.13450  ORF Transcript_4683/g.13450 Transcript_4683/m.13450 type:complete len:140 (-) Transcript_4683:528-947(-)
MMDDRRKIGIGLTGFGFLFSFLGVLFFFDKGLLAMGNILFVAGVAMTIGTQATIRFFLRRKNHRGSACFLVGFLMVVWGWAIVGSLVEGYGFFLLFAGFFPTVLGFLRSVPYLGRVLDAPSLKRVLNRLAPASAQGLPV